MLRGEPLTVADLEFPADGSALDRMAVPTLDAWTAAIATVHARAVSRTPDATNRSCVRQPLNKPVARSTPAQVVSIQAPSAPDWFERTQQQIEVEEAVLAACVTEGLIRYGA